MVSATMKLRIHLRPGPSGGIKGGESDTGSHEEEGYQRSQEDDSDFEAEDAGEEEEEADADDDDDADDSDDSEDGGGQHGGRGKRGRGSSSGTSDDSDSDDSGRRRKRKRPQKKKPKPPPPETAMRRKLRQRGDDGNAALPGSSQQQEAASPRGSSEEKSPPASGQESRAKVAGDTQKAPAITREFTAEEIAKQLEEVQSMWEMASILEFFELFKPQLDLRVDFRAEDLERGLVSTTGEMGLLMDVHRGLLAGIMPRTAMPVKEWHTFLAKQIYNNWERLGGQGTPPLQTGKGQDAAATYAKMSSKQRVLCLKILCDIRMECADIADRIEESLRVSQMSDKKRETLINSRPKRGAAPIDVLEDFRRTPLGVASTGQSYWWMDFQGSTGSRMYCHTPVTRGRRKGFDVSEGKWELIGSTVEQLQKICEAHAKSKKKADRQLVSSVDGVVVELTARADEEERLQRLRSRLRLDVGVIMDDGMGGRSRRARREVKYTFDEFDEMIGEAVREGRRGRSKAEAAPPPEQEEEEEPYDTTGLRRGRSSRRGAVLDDDDEGEKEEEGEEEEEDAVTAGPDTNAEEEEDAVAEQEDPTRTSDDNPTGEDTAAKGTSREPEAETATEDHQGPHSAEHGTGKQAPDVFAAEPQHRPDSDDRKGVQAAEFLSSDEAGQGQHSAVHVAVKKGKPELKDGPASDVRKGVQATEFLSAGEADQGQHSTERVAINQGESEPQDGPGNEDRKGVHATEVLSSDETDQGQHSASKGARDAEPQHGPYDSKVDMQAPTSAYSVPQGGAATPPEVAITAG